MNKILSEIVSGMASEQASLDEVYRPCGEFFAFVPQTVGPMNTLWQNAILYAADDFRNLMYCLQLNDECINRPPPEDVLLRTMEVRALIQQFLIDMRSVFDYMLMATVVLLDTEIEQSGNKGWKDIKLKALGQKHLPNFNTFRNGLVSAQMQMQAESCFGKSLVKLWVECEWFEEVNGWRNAITHEGAFLKVKNDDPDLFCLETVEGTYALSVSPILQTLVDSENALSFRVMSGIYCALLLELLNRWAVELATRVGNSVGRGVYVGRGGTVFRRNIQTALAVCQ